MKRLRLPQWKQLGVNAAGFLVIGTTAVTSVGITGASLIGTTPDHSVVVDSVTNVVKSLNDTGNLGDPVVAYCSQPLTITENICLP